MSAEQDDRKIWLDYLGKLNDRALHRARASGFTAWAVVAVILALCFRLLPALPVIITDASQRGAYLVASTMVLTNIFFASLLFIVAVVSDLDPIEARLQSRLDRVSDPVVKTALGVFCAGVALLSCCSTSLAQRHGLSMWSFGLSAVVFVLLAVSTLGSSRVGKKFEKHRANLRRFASPLAFSTAKHCQKTTRAIVIVLLTCLGITLVPVFEVAPQMSSQHRVDIAVWALSFAGVVYLSLFMVFRVVGLMNSSFLARLERDVVVNALTADQIRDAFIRELLGEDVEQWMSDCKTRTRTIHAEFERAIVDAEAEVGRICALDPSLRFEAAGRYGDLKATLAAAFKKREDDFDQHLTQLEYLKKQGTSDMPSTVHPVDRRIAELKNEFAEAKGLYQGVVARCK